MKYKRTNIVANGKRFTYNFIHSYITTPSTGLTAYTLVSNRRMNKKSSIKTSIYLGEKWEQ